VFKRRNRQSVLQRLAGFLWPKGGWVRAFKYVKIRLRRLPDEPHRIARGIFAGVAVTFTPLFGFHFLMAAFVAWIIRGNIVASLLATFFGNPITFVPIGILSINFGYFLMGRKIRDPEFDKSMGAQFIDAWREFKQNIYVFFTEADADWSNLHVFYQDVFLPYLIGGIIPGIIAGLAAYYISLPLIQAYKNRRKGMIKAKFKAIREKAVSRALPGKKSKEKKSDG